MSKSCRTFDGSVVYWEMERLCYFFSTKAPFEFSSGFAGARADAGYSVTWQEVGHYLSPDVGKNETPLPGHSLWAAAGGAQHCHRIRAASVTLCRGPLHRDMGNLTRCLLQTSAAWVSLCSGCHLQREGTLVSVLCLLLGLSQGHWVSLFQAFKLPFWFCTSRPCNMQERSTPGPISAIVVKEKVDIWDMIQSRDK